MNSFFFLIRIFHNGELVMASVKFDWKSYYCTFHHILQFKALFSPRNVFHSSKNPFQIARNRSFQRNRRKTCQKRHKRCNLWTKRYKIYKIYSEKIKYHNTGLWLDTVTYKHVLISKYEWTSLHFILEQCKFAQLTHSTNQHWFF